MTLSAIAKSVQEAKLTWAVLGGLLGALAVGATLPSRVAALEDRVATAETGIRYVVCVLGAQGRNYDPRPCESHLSADLLDYLRQPQPARPVEPRL